MLCLRSLTINKLKLNRIYSLSFRKENSFMQLLWLQNDYIRFHYFSIWSRYRRSDTSDTFSFIRVIPRKLTIKFGLISWITRFMLRP